MPDAVDARTGDRPQPRRAAPARLKGTARTTLHLLDFTIALGRKVGGFCALLTLGWTYFRILVLGDSLSALYPGSADTDLRQTLWVALLLVMAQGWDIPTDHIVLFWHRLVQHRSRHDASRAAARSVRPAPRPWRALEPTVVRLGRFMDLCVAVANKVGALAVLITLLVLAGQMLAGSTARDLYPQAADPAASLLADICVYVVVLGWWATPFEQITAFWRRLREPVGP